MAHSKPPRKVLCKYFTSNCCFKGDLCPFSHDWDDKPDMVCKYYLKGSCVNGKNCRYDHVKLPIQVGGVVGGASEKRSNSQASRSSPLPPMIRGRGRGGPRYEATRTLVPEPVNLSSLLSTAKNKSHDQQTSPSQRMVTLKDDPSRNPKKWVQAAEFIPGQLLHNSPSSSTEGNITSTKERGVASVQDHMTYSNVVGDSSDNFLDVISAKDAAGLLCPFAEMGHCPFEECDYLHGDICDMCNKQCLNPFDPEQQKAHRKECLEMHERAMEKAFQVQESEGKQCAICMESIINKFNLSDRRFGILANCDHCFCLGCIRKWRGSTSDSRIIRACPLCRVVSYYVVPSEVWIDDVKQKEKLIQEYKDNLEAKHCKYFNMGKGTCPFGTSCFYKHEYPDGKKAVEIPRFCEGAEGERKPVTTNTLWDFLSGREEHRLDTLPAVLPTQPPREQLFGSSRRQEEMLLNYEPDVTDLEFL